MSNLIIALVWITQRPRRLWHLGAAATGALLLESFVGLENRWLLFGLLGVFLVLALPYERLPFTWARLFGVQVRFGIVNVEGQVDNDPDWQTLFVKLNKITVIPYAGDVAHHIIELPTAYRIVFLDEHNVLQTWTESERKDAGKHYRRYSTYAFGNFQSAKDKGTTPVTLNTMVLVERVPT